MFRNALERAFLAFGPRDLRGVVFEAERIQLAHHGAMVFEILVNFDEQRLERSIAKRLAGAGDHFRFEAVNVDLDVMRHRQNARADELVEGACDRTLPELGLERLVPEIERLSKRVTRAADAKIRDVQRR